METTRAKSAKVPPEKVATMVATTMAKDASENKHRRLSQRWKDGLHKLKKSKKDKETVVATVEIVNPEDPKTVTTHQSPGSTSIKAHADQAPDREFEQELEQASRTGDDVPPQDLQRSYTTVDDVAARIAADEERIRIAMAQLRSYNNPQPRETDHEANQRAAQEMASLAEDLGRYERQRVRNTMQWDHASDCRHCGRRMGCRCETGLENPADGPIHKGSEVPLSPRPRVESWSPDFGKFAKEYETSFTDLPRTTYTFPSPGGSRPEKTKNETERKSKSKSKPRKEEPMRQFDAELMEAIADMRQGKAIRLPDKPWGFKDESDVQRVIV